MITCSRCGKENRPDYRFCLGCGAELPKAAEPPKAEPAKVETGKNPALKPFPSPARPPSAPLVPAAVAPASFGQAPVAQPVVAPAPAPMPAPAAMPVASAAMPVAPAPAMPVAATSAETILCSSCGTPNNRNFKFCGACGTPLHGAPVAVPVAAAAPPVAPVASASLVLIRPDGSEGDRIPLAGKMVVGREAGGIFATDSYLSPKHATLEVSGKSLHVTDEASLNGVFVRIAAETPTELVANAIFRIGQEILRYEPLPAPRADQAVEQMGSPRQGLVGRLCLVTGRESVGNCYMIPAAGLHLGRERGDLLFPDDGYVSGLHCRIYEEGGKVFLLDLGSSNGTFTRVHGKQTVASGALILMGQQLFRVDLG